MTFSSVANPEGRVSGSRRKCAGVERVAGHLEAFHISKASGTNLWIDLNKDKREPTNSLAENE